MAHTLGLWGTPGPPVTLSAPAEADRRNLLDMPNTSILPGQVLILVYREGRGELADTRIYELLDDGRYLSGLSPVIRQGNAVAVAARVQSDVPGSGLPVSTILGDVERWKPGLLEMGPTFELRYAFLQGPGAIPDQVAAAAAGTFDAPDMRPDPLGVRETASTIAETARSIAGTLTTWLVVAFAIAAVVVIGRSIRK